MTLYKICAGADKPCCATCFRNAENWPDECIINPHQSWVKPTPTDGPKCYNWLAYPKNQEPE